MAARPFSAAATNDAYGLALLLLDLLDIDAFRPPRDPPAKSLNPLVEAPDAEKDRAEPRDPTLP